MVSMETACSRRCSDVTPLPVAVAMLRVNAKQTTAARLIISHRAVDVAEAFGKQLLTFELNGAVCAAKRAVVFFAERRNLAEI